MAKRQRYEDDDDAVDARGVLRPGRSVRVPTMLRDSASDSGDGGDTGRRVFAADGTDFAAGSRPGFRIMAADSSRFARAGYAAKQAAYSEYTQDLENRWKIGDSKKAKKVAVDPEADEDADEDEIDAEVEASKRHSEGGYPSEEPFRQARRRRADHQMADHQTQMRQLYDRYDAEAAAAWRKG